MYRAGIILFLFAGLAFAKTILYSDVYSKFTIRSITNDSEGLELHNASTATTVNIDGSNSEYYDSERDENSTLTRIIRAANSDYESDDESETESVCKLSEEPPEPGSKCCGIDVSSRPMITGGEPTLLNQYPWLALIEYLDSDGDLYVACGGSLISGLYVLSAAHCFSGNGKPWNVILGDYNKNHNGPDCIRSQSGEELCSKGEVRIRIEDIIKHRNYREVQMINSLKLVNDIALIKLKNMAPYTASIRPICLPSSDLNKADESFLNNLKLTAAGWGIVKQYYKPVTIEGETYKFLMGGKTSDVKMHVNLAYAPIESCRKEHEHVTNYSHICAGGGGEGKNTCRGDSGGPLMFSNDNQYELTGITSYGARLCEGTKTRGVYTNVYSYKIWINKKIRYNMSKRA